MSYEAITQVLKTSQAQDSDRLVLLVIAHHINSRSGKTWLAQPTIMTETRLSRRQVIYSLKRLEQARELFIQHSRGRGHAQMYELPTKGATSAPIPDESGTIKGAESAPIPENKRCKLRPEKVQILSEKVQSTAIKGADSAPLSVVVGVSEEICGDPETGRRKKVGGLKKIGGLKDGNGSPPLRVGESGGKNSAAHQAEPSAEGRSPGLRNRFNLTQEEEADFTRRYDEAVVVPQERDAQGNCLRCGHWHLPKDNCFPHEAAAWLAGEEFPEPISQEQRPLKARRPGGLHGGNGVPR